MRQARFWATAFCAAVFAPSGASADRAELATYVGRCDASAAVAVNADTFVVANDEDNILRVYAYGSSRPIGASDDLSSFLNIEDEDEEADIEGAAKVGDLIYWIGSHARNRKGASRPDRRRFFATRVTTEESGGISIDTEGQPYDELVRDLAEAVHLADYNFVKAADSPAGTTYGLNIEGLAATPDGQLLIGFRGPLANERALVVPILNPDSMIRGVRAVLGQAVELELGGRGIRSMEADGNGGYLIVAGAAEDRSEFRLYEWSGIATENPRYLHDIDIFSYHPEHDLGPEVLFLDAEDPSIVHLLSDDGGRKIQSADPDDEECSDLSKEDEHFRRFTITLDR